MKEMRDSVVVAIRDTVREVTTITIRENEQGDTLRVSTVTDRLRGRSRDAIATQRTKQEIVRDTVYIERRDSVTVFTARNTEDPKNSWGNQLTRGLKWIFWVIVGLTGLVIVIRIRNPAG